MKPPATTTTPTTPPTGAGPAAASAAIAPAPTPPPGTGSATPPSPSPTGAGTGATRTPTPSTGNPFTDSVDWIFKNWLKLLIAILIVTFLLIGIGNALGTSTIPPMVWWAILAIVLIASGQFLVRSKKFNYKYVGWGVTLLGVLVGIWFAGSIVWGWLMTLEAPVVIKPPVDPKTLPPNLGEGVISFLTYNPIWWQLPLAIAIFAIGEALTRSGKHEKIVDTTSAGVIKTTTATSGLRTTGNLMKLGGFAFGVYAIHNVIPETFWGSINFNWVPGFWAQVQTFNLQKTIQEIWATMTSPGTPWGLIAVAVAIPFVLIGMFWLQSYRRIVGWTAAILFIGVVTFVVYRDAIPPEVKTWISTTVASWQAKASESSNVRTPPDDASAPSKHYIDGRTVTKKYRKELFEGMTYTITDRAWLVLTIPKHRCIALDKSAGVDDHTENDDYLVRSFAEDMEVTAYILKKGERLGDFTCS